MPRHVAADSPLVCPFPGCSLISEMPGKKFNPFDLSAKQGSNKSAPGASLQIHIRPELNKPLNRLIARCEMFLERARTQDEGDTVLELQKILSTARYLHSLVNTSEEMRKATVEMELGSTTSEPANVEGNQVFPQDGIGDCGSLLVIDGDVTLLRTLKFILEEQGHTVTTAKSGEEALTVLHTMEFDLVLSALDLSEIDALQLLRFMKADMVWREIPVIILSGLNEPSTAARCVHAGAEDYLSKPVDPVLLQARVTTCLEKKRLRQLERGYLSQLQAEQEKSERLLLNILPGPIAERLKAGESTIADHFPAVTVLFADIEGFTKMAAQVSPVELVKSLNEIFSAFDRLAEKHRLEKIKTIGDAYMVVGGLPTPREDHAEAMAAMALDMQSEVGHYNAAHGSRLKIRIGMHSGPVVAGVIGQKKFNYDLWGDTVNTASRMEVFGQAGQIQTTETTYQLLKDNFTFSKRGKIDVKGKGEMVAYLLTGKRS